MGPETEAQQASYFQDAVVEWGGQTFHFSAADGARLKAKAMQAVCDKKCKSSEVVP